MYPTEEEPSRIRRFFRSLSYYTPSPPRFVFSTALVWHSFLARATLLTPFATLRHLTHIRPITFTSAEILQYLGGLHVGYALMALQGLLSPRDDVEGRKRNALVLTIASLSQMWLSVRFWRNARWSWGGMLPLFVGHAFVTLISFLYYLQQEHRRPMD